SGSTLRSATSRRAGSGASAMGKGWHIGGATVRPKSTTLSARTSPTSTHCSGRDAQGRRLQSADDGPRTRFFDGGRRKNVEDQGNVREGLDVPGAPRPVLFALLLRLQADAEARRPGSGPRRVRGQGERRSGRQAGEPGQPHGAVRARKRTGGPVSRRWRTVRPGGGRRRGDRRGLRSLRLQQ